KFSIELKNFPPDLSGEPFKLRLNEQEVSVFPDNWHELPIGTYQQGKSNPARRVNNNICVCIPNSGRGTKSVPTIYKRFYSSFLPINPVLP
ncbi:hypothetical protein DW033_17650, partial [Parabacteroides sp. AF39-10AC]